MSGPVPKRSEERRRRNTTTESGAPLETDKVEVDEPPVEPFAPNEKWHPDAAEFYQACIDSAQSRFYEPSDWAALKFVTEVMSRHLKPVPVVTTSADGSTEVEMIKMPIKGADLSALVKAWGVLLVTEGDRRRLRLEIQRGADKPVGPVSAEDVVADRAGLFSIPGGKQSG